MISSTDPVELTSSVHPWYDKEANLSFICHLCTPPSTGYMKYSGSICNYYATASPITDCQVYKDSTCKLCSLTSYLLLPPTPSTPQCISGACSTKVNMRENFIKFIDYL